MGKYVLMLFIAAVLITGCSSNDKQQTLEVRENRTPFPPIIEPHNPEQAEESGDVVVLMGEMRNRDKWKTFMQNVKKHQPDQVRVTRYTIEGGPIIHELVYDGELIQSTYDDTRDMYGSRQNKTPNTCAGISTMKSGGWRTFYILTGCEQESTFSIPST
ncbi:DUF4362 domain-containing protein [Paenibacillus silvae]|jgi:PBP1b-binding outer membrane lipoprotein LpoB|uniref:DUF4362 domain-containing protein n=1 Tax=Paenibacillus silvae TaxID=1325358 RepID=UPI0025A1A264|nr:DUF4362 domain-containing protein [Paenibacillus silvae]MDM5279694.1 DUF4362 domain-containing protein [Paenibacillus silvae]